jgi:3-hydroxybutyryl-CoA dehydrogenase
VLRINGWPGFLQRDLWEVAGTINDNAAIVLEKLNKKIAPVKDEPGLVSARIIAMIINEAYFALGDKVSTKEEIDIAMKLGTNYPWGPFEWAEKIGINSIFDLLEKLSITDKRYLPAPLLTEAITKKK